MLVKQGGCARGLRPFAVEFVRGGSGGGAIVDPTLERLVGRKPTTMGQALKSIERTVGRSVSNELRSSATL